MGKSKKNKPSAVGDANEDVNGIEANVEGSAEELLETGFDLPTLDPEGQSDGITVREKSSEGKAPGGISLDIAPKALVVPENCNCTNGKILIPALGAFVDCPICGNKKAKLDALKLDVVDLSLDNLEQIEQEQSDKEQAVCRALKIPPAYATINYVKDQQEYNRCCKMYARESIDRLLTLWDTIYEGISRRATGGTSYIMYSSNDIDSNRFVYATQKRALKMGVSTVPYITLNSLYSLVSSEGKPNGGKEPAWKSEDAKGVKGSFTYEAYSKTYDRAELVDKDSNVSFTYADYIKADLVFLEASAMTHDVSYNALADILIERERLSLPTYVISYWNAEKQYKSPVRFLLNSEVKSRLRLMKNVAVISGAKSKYTDPIGGIGSFNATSAFDGCDILKD